MWDTVGCLGVPDIDIRGMKLYSDAHREYSFVNTEVPKNVEHAYQALAMDEERKPYSPTLWESPKDGKAHLKILKQCWFPGVHSSVGGGYADTSISDITLAWMITQLSRHLTFNPEYIVRQQQQNVQFYRDHDVPVASWAMGSIQRSDTGTLNTALGRQPRTPGQYCVIDPGTGRATKTRLTNTCEFIHPSVRYRIKQSGPDLVDDVKVPSKSTYAPTALANWTYCAPGQAWRDELSGKLENAEQWDDYGKWVYKKDGQMTYIVEEAIDTESSEGVLITAWPGRLKEGSGILSALRQ